MNSIFKYTSAPRAPPVPRLFKCIEYIDLYIHMYIAIPPRIFEMLQSHKDICRRYVRTCKEINIAFLAYEAQVQFSSESTDRPTKPLDLTLLAVNL